MNTVEKFIPPILINIYKKLRRGKRKYRIGMYEINIPPKFALPDYQKKFRLYDRFLPVLAKHLPSGKTIIDVGANIGDTVAALLTNCSNPIICIEPSDLFFPYLEKNLGVMAKNEPSRVKTFKKFVGTGSLTGELVHAVAGTAKIKVNNSPNVNAHIPLDELIEDKPEIVLLKVDTDGFDFDVIRSADKICSESEPILFWENEISEDFQNTGFDELYDWLIQKGYKYVYIFDNFGNLVSENHGFGILKSLNSYIYTMQKNGCARTLNYTDILASTEKYRSVVQDAITEYKMKWILECKKPPVQA